MVVDQHLPDDLLDRHASAPAIAGASLSSNREKSDEHEHRGGRHYVRADVIPSDRLLRMKVKLWLACRAPWWDPGWWVRVTDVAKCRRQEL
ncbi:MAG: hypothetical protein ACXVHJ_25255, partial [Solirubrobacteraceae bacterium]